MPGGASASDIVVTSGTAIQSTPFWAAVQIISNTIASLPFDVFQRRESGQTPAENLPLRGVIQGDVDRKYGRFMFMQKLIASACLGNGYARILRDTTGQVTGFEFLKRSEVMVDDRTESGVPVYRINRTNGVKPQAYVLFDYEVIHIPGLSVMSDWGEEITIVHAPTLEQDLSAKKFGNQYFANGIHSSVVIKHPGEAGPQLHRRLMAMWRKLYGGTNNAGTPMLLDAGMDIVKVSVNPQEAMLVDVRKFTISDVARITNIPLHLLQDLDRATFNNIEVMNAQFVSMCLVPWCEKIECEFNRKCIPESRKGKYFFQFDLKGLMRGNTEARAKFYQSLWGIGAVSSNEVRRMEGLNDRDGGDVYYIPVNMSPWDKLQADPNADQNTDAAADANADASADTNASNSTNNE